MNKIENRFNFKTLIMFLTVLVLSLSMVFATACTKGGQTSTSTQSSSESSSESTSEEAKEDEQLFANGDFEHPTNKYPSKDPITLSSSSTKWTGSVDGEVGYQINSSNVKRGIIDVNDEAEEGTESPWAKLTSNTTYKNVLTTNPGTPATEDDEDTAANEAGTRLLMLYNKDFAAQYVTSTTSLKVPAGQYGKLTVWVYTLNLERTVGSDAGAYIKVKNNVTNPTVEGTTYNPLVIENIDTNSAWKQYTIYLAPNTTKATTFTLVLGLGEGNKMNLENHVKGFVFFDNVSFELIDSEAYCAAEAGAEITVDTSKEEYALTSDRVDGQANTAVKFDLTEGSADTSFNLGGEVAADAMLMYPNNKLAKEYVTYDATKDVLAFNFSSFNNIGAAYTYESAVHTLNGGEYVRISFLAKIEAEDYQTQATIALYDVAKGENVAVFENVSTKDFEDENNDNFARFTFYVANNFFYEKEGVVEFAESMQYQLKISFGPTDESVINQLGGKLMLPIGTATFKDFEIEYLTKDNYSIADTTTDTRAKKATLIGGYESDYKAPETEEEEEDESKDSYNVNVTGYGKILLEEGNVVSLNELTSTTLVRSENTDENNAIIGVVNSKYSSSYNASIEAALNGAKAKLDAMRETETNVNKNVQALAIHNISGANYVLGNVISIPKNTTYVFSIKVYVHTGATAFVKLVDINNEGADFLNYTTKVNSADSDILRDGFATVTFVITTGFESYDVRLKFGVEGEGVALFQNLLPGSANSTYTSFEALQTALNANDLYNFVEESKSATTTYYYASDAHAGDASLRLKDENGNVRKTVSSKKEVDKGYATLDGGESTLIIYNRFNLDDRYIIEAPETETPEVTEDQATQSGGNYGWLQVTSILLALVLVLALIAVVVRKSTEGKNKKRKTTESYYQGYNKNKYSRHNDVAVPDEDEISKDYDYENPENN